eukprot:TRINITY_DN14638_c0_g1_i1.p2 TRINITY_DN14638_c0_g1~~TRINITY_DN14638_c0_g1_i1.p2  ORF type:complete len:277 (+),score=93.77 TRINITY_DN14638_c0_g1_i1:103-831(+)
MAAAAELAPELVPTEEDLRRWDAAMLDPTLRRLWHEYATALCDPEFRAAELARLDAEEAAERSAAPDAAPPAPAPAAGAEAGSAATESSGAAPSAAGAAAAAAAPPAAALAEDGRHAGAGGIEPVACLKGTDTRTSRKVFVNVCACAAVAAAGAASSPREDQDGKGAAVWVVDVALPSSAFGEEGAGAAVERALELAGERVALAGDVRRLQRPYYGSTPPWAAAAPGSLRRHADPGAGGAAT